MNNGSQEVLQDGYSSNLDSMLDIRIRILVAAVSVVIMTMNWISFIALYRTRHTPRTARFLSASLLVFDFVASFMYTVRKTVMDSRYSLMFQLFAMGCNFLGYIDIAIMSIERLVLFHWPNFYLRSVSFGMFKRACLTIWTIYSCEWIIECATCYIFVDLSDVNSLFCFSRVIQRHLVTVYASSTLISCFCLAKISFIISQQSAKTSGRKNTWQNNKATAVVLICIVNYLITTAVGVVMTYLIKELYIRRIMNDLLMVTNAFVDTCIYVLWFKECRMEILKLFSHVIPCFNKKAEKMRMDIFDIMTYSKHTPSSNV